VLNSLRSKCEPGCRLGVLQVHRFACKAGLMNQEIVDSLAAPQQVPAAPMEVGEAPPPTIPPAPESSTCVPASGQLVSDAASPQGAVATAVQTEPADRIEGEQSDGVQAQKQSATFIEPVVAKPVTWFVPACS
jgi:hypothetical protein